MFIDDIIKALKICSMEPSERKCEECPVGFHIGCAIELKQEAFKALERNEADGCKDCKFQPLSMTAYPCFKCKRNYTDYWTWKETRQHKVSEMIVEFHHDERGIVRGWDELGKIVRCKDCIYHKASGVCEGWSRYGTITTRDDGFCAWGARLEDGKSES